MDGAAVRAAAAVTVAVLVEVDAERWMRWVGFNVLVKVEWVGFLGADRKWCRWRRIRRRGERVERWCGGGLNIVLRGAVSLVVNTCWVR